MSSILQRVRRRGERPMIYGRDRERAQLLELLEDAIAGHGSLVLISGEAGIGKTTLVDDLIFEAEARGCLVLNGGCYDLTTTPPYGPWTEITRRYPEQDDLPPLPDQLREGAGMDNIPSQPALFELVASFFTGVADRQPLLLLLEDLHWSDAESLELLRYVSRSVLDHRILIVATYRDDEITRRHRLAQLLPRLIRESRAERVDLHQLEAAAIGELIRNRYELEAHDKERLTAYLEERSEGNPLYVEELLYTLESEGSLADTGAGRWMLREIEAIPVPMLIVQLIEDRLGNLETRTRELLEILAVIGHDVEIDLWRQVSEGDEAELIEATRQALEGQVVVEVDRGRHLQFRHALVREALTSGLVALERQRWHRKTADVLIDSPDPDPDAVVTHLERADDPRLLDWLFKAGDRAIDRLAWDVATERYEQAIKVLNLQRQADPALLCDLLIALGAAQGAAADGRGNAPGAADARDARATYWQAVEAARAADAPAHLARAAMGTLWGIGGVPFTDDRVIDLLEEVLEKLPKGDSSERAIMQSGLAAAYRNFKMYSSKRFESGSEERIEQLSATAIPMADRVGDPLARVISRFARRFAIWHPGRLDEADALDEEALTIDRSGEYHRYDLGSSALNHQFVSRMSRGDVISAKHLINELDALAKETQTPRANWMIKFLRAGLALSEGRLHDAEVLIEEADEIWPNTGIGCNQTFALCRELDRLPDAEPRLTAILARFPHSPWFRLCWILYLLETGDEGVANRIFQEIDVRDLADLAQGSIWPHVMAQYAELCVALDDEERARACYELLEPYPEFIIYCSYVFYCGGSVAHYLGLLADCLGEWQKADVHFEQALEQHQAMGLYPLTAHTQHTWARMLLNRDEADDRVRANELLDQASETADRLGMIRLQRLIAEAREEFGSGDDEAYPFDLSQREVEVLRLVVEGMTDGEIAEELYLSPRTISTYLSSIYNKLGVNSRAAAAAITVRSGLA